MLSTAHFIKISFLHFVTCSLNMKSAKVIKNKYTPNCYTHTHALIFLQLNLQLHILIFLLPLHKFFVQATAYLVAQFHSNYKACFSSCSVCNRRELIIQEQLPHFQTILTSFLGVNLEEDFFSARISRTVSYYLVLHLAQ